MDLSPLDLNGFRCFGAKQLIEFAKDGQTRTQNREEGANESN